jgi:type I restriction enzyme M protein
MEIKISDNRIYSPLKNKYLRLTPEERFRQEFICKLINDYSYSLKQMAQVDSAQKGQNKTYENIFIWATEKDKIANKNPIIIIECKAEHIAICEKNYDQEFNYINNLGAKIFIITNLKETRIFRIITKEALRHLYEINDIPNAQSIPEILEQTTNFTREEFSKSLLKCHNIIRNNDKLSPEAAFDEISKILFMKILYERKCKGTNIFTWEQFKKQEEQYEKEIRPIIKLQDRILDIPYMDYWFEFTKKEFAEDNLFDSNDKIQIKQSSFEGIVKELQIYNLSTTADDVKGLAFEKFLGKTFRGELGQFFTPRTIVDFMVHVLDPQEGELICDPCCGSGGFLIKSFQHIRDKIKTDIQNQEEKSKKYYYTNDYHNLSDVCKEEIDEKINKYLNALNVELDSTNKNSRLYKLSHNYIFGTDANPRMSRTAKMNMIMHGDGHGGIYHHDGLLNVCEIFENRFDIILTNPPFGSHIEKDLKISEADKFNNVDKINEYKDLYGEIYINSLKQVNDHIGKSLVSLYKTGSMSSLTEVLFLERCLNLLKPGGRMGIVLPEGVLNNPSLQRVRDFIESKAIIILITSIPQDVFIASGATIKPSIMFFKKFTEEETEKWKSAKNNAKKEIEKKYEKEILILQCKIDDKALERNEKKLIKKQLKMLEDKIENEIKKKIKEYFDYQIPITKVEKAGISTTGSEIDNELILLEKNYTEYRNTHNLWEVHKLNYNDECKDDIIVRRTICADNETQKNKI